MSWFILRWHVSVCWKSFIFEDDVGIHISSLLETFPTPCLMSRVTEPQGDRLLLLIVISLDSTSGYTAATKISIQIRQIGHVLFLICHSSSRDNSYHLASLFSVSGLNWRMFFLARFCFCGCFLAWLSTQQSHLHHTAQTTILVRWRFHHISFNFDYVPVLILTWVLVEEGLKTSSRAISFYMPAQ